MNNTERETRISQIDKDMQLLLEEKEKLEKEKTHVFKVGDVAMYQNSSRNLRLICEEEGGLFSVSLSHNGSYGEKIFPPSTDFTQEYFETKNYKYVGRISDFINPETVEKFLKNKGE